MRFIKIFSLAALAGLPLAAAAQSPAIQVLESGKKVSIRGLSVVNDHVIWASGSKGSVARSVDGGKTFTWTTVPGYEKNDFRDIEAFDQHTALIMAITEPAAILQTTDGGQTWKKVFEDTTRGAFFDAMDFPDKKNGMLVGDPIQGKIFLALTRNGGNTWEISSPRTDGKGVAAHEGEAFFASSGSNLALHSSFGSSHFVLASGGKISRLLHTMGADTLPILQGQTSTGVNSLAIYKNRYGIVVGGDFTKDTISRGNSVLFTLDPANGYKPGKYQLPQTPPHGYRSCVIYLDKNKLLTCGTSGVDMSKDGGNNWELISGGSYHVCQKAKKGNAVFLAGSNGRIARLAW